MRLTRGFTEVLALERQLSALAVGPGTRPRASAGQESEFKLAGLSVGRVVDTGRSRRPPGWQSTTHRSRRQFFERATSPPWNLTFAEALEQIEVGGCGRSRIPTDDGDRITVVRLHLS